MQSSEFSEAEIKNIGQLCLTMLERSYCIYSKFPVACVLVTAEGNLVTGCNVENASYGLAICAERTALVKAISEGHRKFKACFVMTKSRILVGPCGACRQFLTEFMLDQDVYLLRQDFTYTKYPVRELLPLSFGPHDLEQGVKDSVL